MSSIRSYPVAVSPKLSVLIVEDDPSHALLLQMLFAEEGMQTSVCVDGSQAYDVISASRPHLVILDLLLPGRDGMDVLARLKGDPHTARIPILVCTAADTLLRKAASVFELWSCPVISKPFDVDVLNAMVRRLLAGAQPSNMVVSPSA
jgi:DNA-binding response OmpR family regulator